MIIVYKITIAFSIAIMLMIATTNLEKKVMAQPISSMVCTQGLIVRPNGSITIDEWTNFLQNSQGKPPIEVRQPASVLFGHTLDDSLKVCFEGEENDGSNCVALKEVRRVAFPAKKK